MLRRITIAAVAGICLIGVIVCLNGGSAVAEVESQGNSELSLTKISSDGVDIEFRPPGGNKGVLEAELYELEGNLLAKVTRRHEGEPLAVKLYAGLNANEPANYYIRYRFNPTESFRQRSLLFMAEILETTILGQREFLAGTRPVIRILVRDRAVGAPIAGATVSAELTHEDKVISKFSSKTNDNGEVAVKLDMPDKPLKNAKLKVEVKTENSNDTIEENINILSSLRTLLTTDKPLYQPGQTIHIRALTLSQPGMEPLNKADVIFEVEDSKGNKVFKKAVTTDKFGISHTDFVLANELNMGTYRIRAIAAGAKEEKTVNVERYVLPKFKTDFKTERSFYQPGETVKGEIQSDYFFGKAVSGAKIEIKCSKFDVQYQDFQTIEGKTDEKGHYSFEVELPKHFVGQPLEAGKATAKFEIKITDTADHKETITKNVTVTASPVIIMAVAESGELIPGIENKVYIVTTYADSTPASCSVIWTNPEEGQAVEIQTDEGGFGNVTVKPQQGKNISMQLTAKDKTGQKGSSTINLTAKAVSDDSVLLRTNKTLYKPGDQLDITVFSTRKKGTVYIDLIKDRQTYLTKTLELNDNVANGLITIDASLAGTVQVNAYLIGSNGVIVRDRKLAIVDPANDLKIDITADEQTYLPGKEAKLRFKVTNNAGNAVTSALGVMVVDEAVFALQEMQPGLEKVYFYLEKEIATPRYEIHGYELDHIISPPTLLRKKGSGVSYRDSAAKVLLASAKGVGDYALHVNTYQRDNKASAFMNKMTPVLNKKHKKIQTALAEFAKKNRKKRTYKKGIELELLVEQGYLKQADILDPWGTKMKITGHWCNGCQTYHNFVLESAGIDGQWYTIDDVSTPDQVRTRWKMKEDRNELRFGIMDGVAEQAAREPMMLPEGADFDKLASLSVTEPASAPPGGQSPVRIREYFPETLYFEPALITDARGIAELNVPLADSITTWRLTCMASSAAGQLGSNTAGIRVFQDFFVDIDFPVSLTQNDEVHVPVAIYNYLKTDQTIKLQVKKENWFELKGLAEKTVTLAPSEVRAVYFPIVAKKIGFKKFTVTARGTKASDAVARTVEIVPDGKEHLINHSGRLEGRVAHTITIPANAIEDASKIFVKIYPGVLSQVVEGLDKMLRMPFGCFEQTSSVTYPNILVLDYMKSSGKITPELQLKAEGFINAGYQRLVSFEVPGGGFEWFGKAPAHRILTAYGLMEFYDMSKVYEVDPAVISRTQQWLAKAQENDGSYKPSAGGIREGAINKFTDDVFRNTAYITWALASTGYDGPQIAKGVEYLRNNLSKMKDTYTIALTANALTSVDAKDQATIDVISVLTEKAVEKDDYVYWPSQSETPTHGTGAAADIEVTSLAVQALIGSGRELGTVSKAITYLVKNKDAYGTWQSTQATIQALRAMLMAQRGATAISNGQIKVIVNDQTVKELKVDESNSDVLQLVDLKDMTKTGDTDITLEFKGKGSLLYQVVGRYYLPHSKTPAPEVEPMTIDIDYDRTQLESNDIINVTATVSNNRPGKAKMVIIDLGLPPGFTLISDKLDKLVADETIEKYSTTGRQIIVYLREVTNNEPVTISYQLLAKYPLKAKTPKSAAYEYYNPDIRVESQPIQLTVTNDQM